MVRNLPIYLWDLLLIVVTLVVAVLMNRLPHRTIVCLSDNPSFARPYKPELFPFFLDICIQFVILGAAEFDRSPAETSAQSTNNFSIRRVVRTLCWNWIITSLLKTTIVAPRPFTYEVLSRNKIVKGASSYVIRYPRLSGDLLDTFHSFPSGHTSTAVATMLLTLGLKPSLAIQVGSVLWAIVVSVSRLTGNRHHPIDVLCGAILGWAVFRTVGR